MLRFDSTLTFRQVREDRQTQGQKVTADLAERKCSSYDSKREKRLEIEICNRRQDVIIKTGSLIMIIFNARPLKKLRGPITNIRQSEGTTLQVQYSIYFLLC